MSNKLFMFKIYLAKNPRQYRIRLPQKPKPKYINKNKNFQKINCFNFEKCVKK